MSSPHDKQALSELRTAFGRLCVEFPRWLCWPEPSGEWHALELGYWFRAPDEVYLFRASSVTDLREWLRGFEEHARAWRASRRDCGLPAADPPIPDFPRVRPATLDTAALTARINEAVNALCPPDPPVTKRSAAGPPMLTRPAAERSASVLARAGGHLANGCRRYRPRPFPRGNGPGRARPEHS